jgi:hypothetical protein
VKDRGGKGQEDWRDRGSMESEFDGRMEELPLRYLFATRATYLPRSLSR